MEANRYYVYAKTRKKVAECLLGRMAEVLPRPALLKTLPLNVGLTSFSPASGYPRLDLYLARAVQDCLHPFDHRSF
jgi:hypothetical protein